ncbi:MAG: glycoside hydrolase family 78 protein [Verrucomicrobia bacterium]|nr:glycoside hydrolase family 78 protein [Verrucomicrobiota bacterium]
MKSRIFLNRWRSFFIWQISTAIIVSMLQGALFCYGDADTGKAGCSLRPVDLRCEYLIEPLGIDVKRPRLSWALSSADKGARGLRQTSYRIEVASSMEDLRGGEADLWDSGIVESDDSTLIGYGGKRLESGQVCLWRVKVRDAAGVWSEWSEPSRWTMGLLEPSDWRAKWIGTGDEFKRKEGWPPPDNEMPDPWFRKSVNLDEAPSRAVLYVGSVGYHEVYVNGRKVGDIILVPNATDNTKRARYRAYEIAEYLNPGENVIGLWLGVSWSIFPPFATDNKPRAPLVIMQGDIRMPGGEQIGIRTDASWKTHPSPNTLLGVWDFMHFGGEEYDAREAIPDWCSPDFDDSKWSSAVEYDPELQLSSDFIEPNTLKRRIHPVSIETTEAGGQRVDMGVNFAGWVEIDVSGNPGTRVEFQFSERADAEMTHRLRSAYVIGPSGEGTFKNHFNYSVGRWILVKGLDAELKSEDVRGWLVRSDFERAGRFECSDELFNEIYETTSWTFENLSLGGYVVDCPHRERMGYGGDAHATICTALDNYRVGAFYTKWAQDWRDVQKPNGDLPYTAPTYWGGGGPAWSGFCITLPWEVYRAYGDKRILRENFATMTNWLEFLETKSADNLLVRWGGEWDFLGDWLWPGAEGVNGDTRETLFFNNCYWVYNLQTASKIARIIGEPAIAEKYEARAERVRRAVHKEFFVPGEDGYVNCFQAYLATALLTEVPPEGERADVWERLEKEILDKRNGHIHAGITGGAMLFKTLMEYDRNDLISTMVGQEDYPGWGDMLERGATTFWEAWDGRNSRLHSSYLYVGAWFIHGVGGIRPGAEPGYEDFVIRPAVPPETELEWASTSYMSEQGRIKSDWRVSEGKLELDVCIPPNTTARVYLPHTGAGELTESGAAIDKAAGVRSVTRDGAFDVVAIGSGEYEFESRLD